LAIIVPVAINADRRSMDAERDPAATRSLDSQLLAVLKARLAIAKALVPFWKKAAFVFEGCSSVEQFVAQHHGDWLEGRTLLRVGIAIENLPKLEAHLLAGRVGLEDAAWVGLAFLMKVTREGDDWVDDALNLPRKKIRSKVRERIAERELGAVGLVEMQFFVPEKTREQFGRCRDLASTKEGKPLSHEQTFQRVVGHYLEDFDPLRQEGRERRSGPTAPEPGTGPSTSRHVPQEVRRGILERSEGKCEVPQCGRRGEHLCHFVPHAAGSGRELTDLWYGCQRHHLLYDAKRLFFAGWTGDGRPTFRNRQGKVMRPEGVPPPGSGRAPGGSPACGSARGMGSHTTRDGKKDRPGRERPGSRPTGDGVSERAFTWNGVVVPLYGGLLSGR
jgi:hypothetical protein